MEASGIDIRRTDDGQDAIALGIAAGLDDRGRGDVEVAAVWGAYDGESLVGTVTLGWLQGLTVVSWLAVEEAYRGRGLGRLLLGEREAEARRRGVSEIWPPCESLGASAPWGTRRASRPTRARRFSRNVDPAAVSVAPAVRRWSSSAGRHGPEGVERRERQWSHPRSAI